MTREEEKEEFVASVAKATEQLRPPANVSPEELVVALFTVARPLTDLLLRMPPYSDYWPPISVRAEYTARREVAFEILKRLIPLALGG